LLGYKASAWQGLAGIGVRVLEQRVESLPAPLESALKGDLFWDKVVAIDELPDRPEFVYDIAVEPGENFIAGFGGIFAHNSEAHLRNIFQEAGKRAPSIIFLDELDAIAPKRENVQGEVEKRVVAQLLALMDGLKERGQIIVIGATNLPNILDPALRRPGRFDREIAIGIPDRNGRLAILEIHSRGMPLADDVDLGRLADITHGFVGADLEALCREAAMITLRQIIPNIDFAQAAIPYEQLLKLTVTQDAFLAAMADVEPTAIREVFTEIPDVKWGDVGGLDEVKQALREAVEWPLKHAALFERAKTRPPKGILLTGPPGCGKTLLAKAVASESEANFISIKGPQLLSKWVGESEKGVREVFKKARQASPCIVFLDEIDALAPARGAGGDSHVSERVVSQLLTELDGIEELRGVVVLAATNRPDIVDPALLRPGRFDLQIELPVPDAVGRRAIFAVHTRGKPLAVNVDLNLLVKRTAGQVGADIEGLCRGAALAAIRDFLATHPAGENPEELVICMKHFEDVLRDTGTPDLHGEVGAGWGADVREMQWSRTT
jgi:transitional endoplasmic reticulum ATPase